MRACRYNIYIKYLHCVYYLYKIKNIFFKGFLYSLLFLSILFFASFFSVLSFCFFFLSVFAVCKNLLKFTKIYSIILLWKLYRKTAIADGSLVYSNGALFSNISKSRFFAVNRCSNTSFILFAPSGLFKKLPFVWKYLFV